MSFKLFIYYCALSGGWAAFLTWAMVQPTIRGNLSPYLYAILTGGLLGAMVAAAIGAVDAYLNAIGFQRVVRVLLCLVIGFAGGLLGSLVGQFLHDKLRLPIVFGWVLTGTCIGASLGVYDLLRAVLQKQDLHASLRKTLNGIYGGLLGGFLGGLPFGFLIGNDKIPRTDLALSLVILGLCIGLFIGTVQVILKEAWIKVTQGRRAGRELLLSKEETTIGRAESCDLGLFGDNQIEKLHARILLQNNRYLLADADTPGGTYLNDQRVTKPMPLKSGDTIRVGGNVLEFGERQKRT